MLTEDYRLKKEDISLEKALTIVSKAVEDSVSIKGVNMEKYLDSEFVSIIFFADDNDYVLRVIQGGKNEISYN